MGHYTNWVTPSFSKFNYLKNEFASFFNFCLIKNIALAYLPKYEYKKPSFSVVIFMPDAKSLHFGFLPTLIDHLELPAFRH